ncbi:pectate lyase family protein [Cellvibrio japonicus]|uniref:Pectate lyase, putative, pel1B n=1 Tax=Cellvibrio japonicus (strain Ueda107) TaxID=498211 RepID=B3PJ22_CELJU|nr:carbohydrate-binding protein [Cellvibrio japonicus]ACE85953.1 pectate lyase, putative, pel1B [Cellvibrio japonicus Ueda107]QEI11222.1 carbohydrate-binding protein [Cellvibrio japonicus]QEI14796.1 carbohydrate-binding protein [Cellvibrio japonicus]QEI18376.1 carbohydrate-binding protein [Cellvibrio japonicus]
MMCKKFLSGAVLALASTVLSSHAAAITIQENDPGFCSYDGVISTAHSGYTGAGYVDIHNAGGQGISYQINVATAGSYNVSFRYANRGSTSAALVVNGSSGSLSFPRTASLSSWNTVTKTVNLVAGVNQLRLRATGSQEIANIDFMAVDGGAVSGACGSASSSVGVSSSSSSVTVQSSSHIASLSSSSSAGTVVSSSVSSSLFSSTPSSSSRSSSSVPVSEVPDFSMTGFAAVSALGVPTTTGGAGGEVVRVTTFEQLQHYVTASAPYVIQVEGSIQPPAGYVKFNVTSNKTIVGVGSNATLRQIGFRVGGSIGCSDAYNANTAYVSNVIIRNLTFRDVYDAGSNPDADAVTVECFSHHVWVDHNTFIYSAPNSTLMGRIDGAVDVKRGGDWVTVSWNHFYQYNKTMLLGHVDSNALQDSGRLHVTYHHNYFENTHQRHPRVRFGKAHIFNNYFFNDKTGPNRQISYIALAGPESELYLEANHIWVDSGELYVVSEDSDRNARVIFTHDNIVRLVNPNAEWLLQVNNSQAFEPRDFYPYSINSASVLPTLVPAYAGAGKLAIVND